MKVTSISGSSILTSHLPFRYQNCSPRCDVPRFVCVLPMFIFNPSVLSFGYSLELARHSHLRYRTVDLHSFPTSAPTKPSVLPLFLQKFLHKFTSNFPHPSVIHYKIHIIYPPAARRKCGGHGGLCLRHVLRPVSIFSLVRKRLPIPIAVANPSFLDTVQRISPAQIKQPVSITSSSLLPHPQL